MMRCQFRWATLFSNEPVPVTGTFVRQNKGENGFGSARRSLRDLNFEVVNGRL